MTDSYIGGVTAPDILGEITGYRQWKPVRTTAGLRLRSEWSNTVWAARVPLVAEHLGPQSFYAPVPSDSCPGPFSPSTGCQCGIYGYSDPSDALSHGNVDAAGFLIGAVAMWGKVIEHERGYRAQHARPLSILQPVRKWRRVAQRIAEAYGIPIVGSAGT